MDPRDELKAQRLDTFLRRWTLEHPNWARVDPLRDRSAPLGRGTELKPSSPRLSLPSSDSQIGSSRQTVNSFGQWWSACSLRGSASKSAYWSRVSWQLLKPSGETSKASRRF